MDLPRVATLSIFAGLIVLFGWLGGLALWGAPASGFPAQFPLEGFALIIVIGGPAMLVGGLAVGFSDARSGAARVLGASVWIGSSVVLAYLTSFVHFGGFCLDPNDACMVRWPSRATALVLAIVIVAGGALVATAVDRLTGDRHRRRGPDSSWT